MVIPYAELPHPNSVERHPFVRLIPAFARPLRRLVPLAALMLFAGACSASVVSFSIGECVNLPDGEVIDDVEVVDCEEPHDGEVFALPQMPDGEDAPFDATAVSDFATERCQGQAFTDYVGQPWDTSAIYSTPVMPSQDSWENADDREVACLLVGPPILDADGQPIPGAGFEQLTGTKQGSNE